MTFSEKIKSEISGGKKEMMDYCHFEMEKMMKQHEAKIAMMDGKMDKNYSKAAAGMMKMKRSDLEDMCKMPSMDMAKK